MEPNRPILKITLGFAMFFLLLACDSNKKPKDDSLNPLEVFKTEKANISVPEKRDMGSHPDTIVINGMQFRPAELHIKKGDTVVWVNRDIVVHDASEFPDKKWTSGPLANGSSWKIKVDKSYDYFCSIHITMKGKLVVDP